VLLCIHGCYLLLATMIHNELTSLEYHVYLTYAIALVGIFGLVDAFHVLNERKMRICIDGPSQQLHTVKYVHGVCLLLLLLLLLMLVIQCVKSFHDLFYAHGGIRRSGAMRAATAG
jgi:hypothetical protein